MDTSASNAALWQPTVPTNSGVSPPHSATVQQQGYYYYPGVGYVLVRWPLASPKHTAATAPRYTRGARSRFKEPSYMPYYFPPAVPVPTSSTVTSTSTPVHTLPSPTLQPQESSQAETLSTSASVQVESSGGVLRKSNTTEVEANEILAKMGLAKLEIAPDGSCLFRAVSEQLFLSQTMHKWLREKCVEFIREHYDDFLPYLETIELSAVELFEEYLQKMTSDQEWGGELELQAISLMFEVNIHIYSSQGITKIDNGFDSHKVVLLWYSHGNHYDCVLPLKTMKANMLCQEIVNGLVNVLFYEPDAAAEGYRNIHMNAWHAVQKSLTKTDKVIAQQITSSEAVSSSSLQHQRQLEVENELAARRVQDAWYREDWEKKAHSSKHKSKKDKSEDKKHKKKGLKKQFKALFRQRRELPTNASGAFPFPNSVPPPSSYYVPSTIDGPRGRSFSS